MNVEVSGVVDGGLVGDLAVNGSSVGGSAVSDLVMSGVGVSDLLAAAREMKAPLATMRQLALAFDGLDRDGERIRMEMVGVSERAMRQMDDLMRLEKLGSGLFEMEPVAVRGVCGEARAEAVRLAQGRREIGVEYRNRTPLVTANRELLSSVVYNLLLIAAEVSQDNVRMVIRDAREGVEIAVRDKGPVMAAMRLGANGLMLPMVTRFAKYMMGNMRAVRHRDGMSFVVWLPKSRQGRLW